MTELSGKRVTRSRSGQEWSYRFNVAGRTFKGCTRTLDRAKAEEIADKIYQDAKATKTRTELLAQINIIIEQLENELRAARAERARLTKP